MKGSIHACVCWPWSFNGWSPSSFHSEMDISKWLFVSDVYYIHHSTGHAISASTKHMYAKLICATHVHMSKIVLEQHPSKHLTQIERKEKTTMWQIWFVMDFLGWKGRHRCVITIFSRITCNIMLGSCRWMMCVFSQRIFSTWKIALYSTFRWLRAFWSIFME